MASVLALHHRGGGNPPTRGISDELIHRKGEVQRSHVTNALGRGEGEGISKEQARNNWLTSLCSVKNWKVEITVMQGLALSKN